MDQRSQYIFGKDFFMKVVNIEKDVNQVLEQSLQNSNTYLPFASKEIVINYLLEDTNLVSPKTKVLVSENYYTIEDFNKDLDYNQIVKKFISFEDYLLDFKRIKTGIIISEKVDGNLDKFLRSDFTNEDLENAFIHIAYLYYKYQEKYKAIHGDPKTANYTWKKLDKEKEMTYDFGDFSIQRKVKNLFFLTDLEFVYSPKITSKTIKNKTFYFNFSKKYEWMDDNRKDLIYVPKISAEPYYDYNVNLYGGYSETGEFPRFLALDILVLVKMILTWPYTEVLSPYILKIFNMYFTKFRALSEKKKENNYKDVFPKAFAKLIVGQ